MSSTPASTGSFALIAQRLRHGVPAAELCSPWDRRSLPVYSLIGLNFVFGMLLMQATHISFGRDYWVGFLSWPILAILTGMLLRRVGYARFASMMELLGLIYGQGLVAFLVIVPGIALSLPFADDVLSRADLALGFDWHAYEAATRSYLKLFLLGYRSFVWQPALVVIALVATRRSGRAWQFVTAAAVALAITAVIFPLAPAEGPFHHYGVRPDNLLAERWTNEVRPLFIQVKQGTLRHIDSSLVTGVVAFPSYHTAAGILFIWALWPMRWLRWPIALLNALMIGSTLTIGAHYLIDLLAGFVVAGVSIPVGAKLIRGTGRRDTATDHMTANLA